MESNRLAAVCRVVVDWHCLVGIDSLLHRMEILTNYSVGTYHCGMSTLP